MIWGGEYYPWHTALLGLVASPSLQSFRGWEEPPWVGALGVTGWLPFGGW